MSVKKIKAVIFEMKVWHFILYPSITFLKNVHIVYTFSSLLVLIVYIDYFIIHWFMTLKVLICNDFWGYFWKKFNLNIFSDHAAGKKIFIFFFLKKDKQEKQTEVDRCKMFLWDTNDVLYLPTIYIVVHRIAVFKCCTNFKTCILLHLFPIQYVYQKLNSLYLIKQ